MSHPEDLDGQATDAPASPEPSRDDVPANAAPSHRPEPSGAFGGARGWAEPEEASVGSGAVVARLTVPAKTDEPPDAEESEEPADLSEVEVAWFDDDLVSPVASPNEPMVELDPDEVLAAGKPDEPEEDLVELPSSEVEAVPNDAEEGETQELEAPPAPASAVSITPVRASAANSVASEPAAPLGAAAPLEPPTVSAAEPEPEAAFSAPPEPTASGVSGPALDLPPLPEPESPHAEGPFAEAPDAEAWERLVGRYERELVVVGEAPAAAELHLEVGRIYEEKLGRARNAATAYQSAFNLDPRHPGVLHASRRLFAEVGNWAMVAQIVGYEVERAEGDSAKASLLAEQGLILEHEVRDLEAARAAYRRALEVRPDEALALGGLERSYLFEKDYGSLFALYVAGAEAAPGTEREMRYLMAAARLAEDRLGDGDRAIELYRRVADRDPKSLDALDALRRLHHARQETEALAEVLERAASKAAEPSEAARDLLWAARRVADGLGDDARAIALVERGLSMQPEHVRLLREAERLLERSGKDEALLEVLGRLAEVEPRAEAQADALHRRARVAERLGQLDVAVDALRAALRLAPGFRPAAQALGRTLSARGDFEALAELYRVEIDAETELEEKVGRLYRLAELQDSRLGQPEAAEATLRELLGSSPRYQPARKLLEQLLTRGANHEGLVALYEEEVELTSDRELQVFLLARLGQLAEEKLADLPRARGAYARVLELSPRHLGAIRALGRVSESLGDHAELVRALELEAEATEDPKEIVALLHRRARIQAEDLGEVDAAVEGLSRVLSLSPSYLPALRTLGQLHASAGRWDALLEMHQRELEVVEGGSRRSELLHRIAQVRWDRLGDVEGAIEAYEAILEAEPDDRAAGRALCELYLRKEAWAELAEVRRKEAESTEEPAERAMRLVEVAELCEERLDRADQAAELYQQAIKLGFELDTASEALIRLYSREGMWNALGAALETAAERARQSGDARTELSVTLALARVHADKLKSLDRAAEALERCVELAPEDCGLLEQLERTSMARRDLPRAQEIGERLASLESEPELAAARNVHLAQRLRREGEAGTEAAQRLKSALEASPGHPVALRALESAYLASRSYAGLAALHEREALATSDERHRVAMWVRAAELWAERLDDPERARTLLDRALAAAPGHLPALRARRRLAERSGEAALVLEFLRREGAHTPDPGLASRLLFETGCVLQDELKDHESASESFGQVLQREPDHREAFERLSSILASRGDEKGVFALRVARAEALEPGEERTELWVSAGQLAQDRLNDRAAARDAFRSALEGDPRHPEALGRLGPIAFAEAEWDEAIDLFHRTLAVAKDPTVLRDAFKALGTIYQEHRRDLVKSVQSFQAALQADPSDTEALHRLARLYLGARDYASTINVMLRLAEVEPRLEDQTAALMKLAELYLEGPKDARLAISALRKAVELDPSCRPALAKLCELHEGREEWPELVEAAGAYVSLLGPEERGQATPMHLRMAEVFETRLGDDHRAINALRYALEDRPDDAQALSRLAALHAKRTETVPHAVAALRRLLVVNPFDVESYHRLFALFERLGQHDQAFVVAEILVFLQAPSREEQLFFHENKVYAAQVTEGVLGPDDRSRCLSHPDARGPMTEALTLLAPELGRILAQGASPRHDRTSKLNARQAAGTIAIAEEIAEALGAGPNELWAGAPEALGAHVELDRPPAVVIGGRFAKRVPPREQRFTLGRALEQVASGSYLLAERSDREIEALFWAVAKLGRPELSTPVDPAAFEVAQRRVAKVSGRVRRALEEVGRALAAPGAIQTGRLRSGAVLGAIRAGYLVSGEIETAVRVVARGRAKAPLVFTSPEGAVAALGEVPEVRDLLAYAVSEGHFEARAKLGLGILPP